MTSELRQRAAVASRVERLVERAMALAVDESDDDLAVARLAWLACWPGPATTTFQLGHLAAPGLAWLGSRAVPEPPGARGQHACDRDHTPVAQPREQCGHGREEVDRIPPGTSRLAANQPRRTTSSS
jgi:hypothetical protein